LTRTYRPEDANIRPFGRGMTHPYAIFLWSANPYQEADLILPDGGRVHYVRISPGTGYGDAVFEHSATPSRFYKSQLRWNGWGWDLTLTDGLVYRFGENAPLQSIRDRFGNSLTLARSNGQSGTITQITASKGRRLRFTYEGLRITQATDDLGHTVTHTYDPQQRLIKVADATGGTTEYTYDANHRMLTRKDSRGTITVTNEYDTDGRVVRQTLADGGVYQFSYTTDAGGAITQANVTDPRSLARQVTFNASGYSLTDTRALGRPEQQTRTFTRDATSHLLLSETDALGRRTEFTYDARGNVTSVTQLAGTAEAMTTTLTYESTFNQLASVNNPLGHMTTFTYDQPGEPD
jgi:YD repeat-containing protein